MSKLINRVTMFKLDGAENQAKLLAAYEKLAKEQNRVSRVVNEAHAMADTVKIVQSLTRSSRTESPTSHS